MNEINLFKTFAPMKGGSSASKKAPRVSPGRAKEEGTRSMRLRDQSAKPYVSASDIRDKVMKRHEAKARAAQNRQVKGQKLGAGFMQSDEVKSDIAANDPNDPMTKEKLKSLLSSGAMNFDSRQKAVLAKVLANN